jgi:hypothetical protein
MDVLIKKREFSAFTPHYFIIPSFHYSIGSKYTPLG